MIDMLLIEHGLNFMALAAFRLFVTDGYIICIKKPNQIHLW